MADTESVQLNGTSGKTEDSKVEKNGENVTENQNSNDIENEKNGENVSELENQIIEQIEYYFGDCNLPRDKFLQQEIKKDNGWVPLEVLLKFRRLAKLSSDAKVIVSALKKSQSGLIEVHEDNTKIRRCPTRVLPEMNEARRQQLVNQSLYVKGFPTENIEMDSLIQFFKKYTKVQQLIMRKYLDKATKSWNFKGSVFAVFNSVEEAEKVLKMAPLKYEDTELIIKWQKDYNEEKKNTRLQSRLEGQKQKRKLKEDEADEDNEEEEKKDELPKGASLYLSDCPEELTREELKAKIEDFGITVAFVYFSKGDKEGWIRLQEPNSAPEVVKDLKDGKLVLSTNVTVSVRALEGEEEVKFLERAKDDMAKRRNKGKGGFRAKRGRKGRGGGGGGYSYKRKGSPHREESKRKIAAVDAE